MPSTKDKQRAIAVLLDKYDRKHLNRLLRRKKVVDSIYNEIAAEAARIGVACPFDDPDKPFYLKDYPAIEKRIDEMMAEFAQKIETSVIEGNRSEWLLSAEKNAAMIDLLAKGTNIPTDTLKAWKQPNLDALQAFQGRKTNGMGLSERVWNLSEQTKSQLELALDVGLGQGKSAAELSRDVRKYLKEPNKLFRRVRDKEGNLRLSKNAQAYHPGQGVYRSSYKNALRMTATENNMAYRTADHDKWNQLDFVIGIEVELSNNHTLNGVPFSDICDMLQGKYPKDFKFTGWHPFCRCIATPILADFDEVLDQMDSDNPHFSGEITDVPEGYNKWIEDNKERIASAKSMPYFVKDNPQYIDNINKRNKILEQAKARHDARTPEQIELIKTRAKNRQILKDNNEYELYLDSFSQGNEWGISNKKLVDMFNSKLKKDEWGNYEISEEFIRFYDKINDRNNEWYDVRRKISDFRLSGIVIGDVGKLRYKQLIQKIDDFYDNLDKSTFGKTKANKFIKQINDEVASIKQHRADVLAEWNAREDMLNAVNSTPTIDSILKANTTADIEKILIDKNIAKCFDMKDMTLSDQKIVAEVMVNIQQMFDLDPIDIRLKDFGKKNSSTFMWACGRYVEANKAYWDSKNIGKTTKDSYDNCVTTWKERHEKDIKLYESWVEEWNGYLKEGKYNAAWLKKNIKKYQKLIDEQKLMIEDGMSRHNVFLSSETMLRDCFTHETGHTIHDQILGGINSWSRKTKYNASDAAILDEELKKLHKNHKKSGGGWLSEYGLSKHTEFMAESSVLYMYAPDKLPADVRHWFDLLKDFARTGKLQTTSEMPSVKFKETNKKKTVKSSSSDNVKTSLTPEQKARRKEILDNKDKWIKKELDVSIFDSKIIVSNKAIKEWLNQPYKYVDAKFDMILDIENVIKQAKYLGYGKDKHDASIKAHLFEIKVKDDRSWIIIREFSNGEIKLHSISDNETIVNIISK